jgi:hypothetical protein
MTSLPRVERTLRNARLRRSGSPANARPGRALALGFALALLPSVLSGASVRDFGAIGDGVADDTAAIKAAVAGAKDGLLIFPRGNYRITSTIEVQLTERGFTSLNGQNGTGRVTMAGPGPAFRFVGTHNGSAGPTTFKPHVWEKERMPQIDGIEIVGGHADADGLEFIRCMQPTVRSVLIREVRHGIRIAERNRNVLITASHIYNNRGVGIYFDRVDLHQTIIQGNHISYNKRGGIRIDGGSIRNFHVTGNDIEYNYDLNAPESADIWFDLRKGSVAEGTIASNTIQAVVSPGGANIRFIGPGRPEQQGLMGLWSITGNLIGNQEVNIHLVHARGITIAGNHIYTGKNRNIVIEESRHIVLSGNSLDQSHNYRGAHTNGITLRDSDGISIQGLVLDRAGGGDATAGGAIEVLNCRETLLTGCQVFEPQVRGIYVAGSRNTTITNSQVLERTASGTMLSAIHVTNDSRGVLVESNLLSRGRDGDLIAPPGSSTRGNQAAVR